MILRVDSAAYGGAALIFAPFHGTVGGYAIELAVNPAGCVPEILRHQNIVGKGVFRSTKNKERMILTSFCMPKLSGIVLLDGILNMHTDLGGHIPLAFWV